MKDVALLLFCGLDYGMSPVRYSEHLHHRLLQYSPNLYMSNLLLFYIYMYACIHMYVHTYIHTCTHTYVHTYTPRNSYWSTMVQLADLHHFHQMYL